MELYIEKGMLVVELRKDHYDMIAKPFKEETGADFLDCWGRGKLSLLFAKIKEFKDTPKTKQAISEVAKIYKDKLNGRRCKK